MALQHIRNFEQTLTNNITNVATSFDISDASLLPSSPTGTIPLTIDDGTNLEIVYYVSKSTNTITVTRGEEGTSGTAFNSGTPIECRFLDTSVDNKADGAASSTDNAFARFDATTGKILQNSQTTEDDDGNVAFAGHSINSITAGITASTTQTQGQQALTKDINEISTVANTNDTVTLPSAVAGKKCVVINNGANTLQIFPASGDNLGQGVDTATTLAAANTIIFVAYDGTNWEEVVNTSASGGGDTFYGFHVYLSSSQSCTNSVYTTINFDTETFDPQSDFDNVTNFRYTPSTAGKYFFYASSGLISLADQKQCVVRISLNGAAIVQGGFGASGTFTQYTFCAIGGVVMNGTTDYVDVQVFNGDTTARSAPGASFATFFGGYKTGD